MTTPFSTPGNTPPEMRIGDSDREAAVSALGEHYAAGRLTREEYDERTEQAWAAKTGSVLLPLFADLPAPWPPGTGRRAPSARAEPGRRPSGSRGGRGFPLVPVVLVALIALVVLTGAPWLLFVAFGIFWCSGWGRRGWQHSGWEHHARR